MNGIPTQLTPSEEVGEALAAGRPVLALESTIITHGMPWPKNLETARQAATIVRSAGAVPAIVALVDGQARIGLDDAALERLAGAGDEPRKCSRRDLAALLASGATAGTTVAATMILAHLAGIRVFATGGIGGVHRGGERTLDVSADLQELARTPVAVVCAGPKAILDLELTREYLETQGVPIFGYRTDELPAFYTRSSGLAVDYRLDSVDAITRVIRQQDALGLQQGLVVAQAVPEAYALPAEKVTSWIDLATQEAVARGIGGKALTPYLLQRIEAHSGGASLQANVELMLNNARLGAQIAVALAAAGEDA